MTTKSNNKETKIKDIFNKMKDSDEKLILKENTNWSNKYNRIWRVCKIFKV